MYGMKWGEWTNAECTSDFLAAVQLAEQSSGIERIAPDKL
jgi:hypothetical protein